AGDQRIVDHGDELARHTIALAIDEVARAPPDRAPVDAAGEEAEDRAADLRIEDDRALLRVALPSAELRHGAPRGLAPHLLVGEQAREVAPRRPVAAAALLAALVVGDRAHAERRVGAVDRAAEAAARDERPPARHAREGRALAVR